MCLNHTSTVAETHENGGVSFLLSENVCIVFALSDASNEKYHINLIEKIEN